MQFADEGLDQPAQLRRLIGLRCPLTEQINTVVYVDEHKRLDQTAWVHTPIWAIAVCI